MRGNIAVRVNDGASIQHVTAAVSGLRLSRSAFGGDKAASCRIVVPRGTFSDLGPGDEIELFDGATGRRIWQGNTDNPGASSGPEGDAYDLTAFGGAARLDSATTALGYVVDDMTLWDRSPNSVKGANTSQDEKRDGTQTLEVSANDGKSVGTNWIGGWVFRALRANDLKVARARADVDSGIANANYVLRLRTGTSIDDVAIRDTRAAGTIIGSLTASLGGGNAIANGDNLVELTVVRNASSVSATDDHWFRFSGCTVRQRLKNVDGSNIVDGYTGNTILASAVVADMVGRGMAPGADPALTSIATTSFPINALHWLDGVTFADAMDDLLAFEPDLFWMLQGSKLTVGLWDDDQPRYVISRRDGGVSFPGQELTLCNRVAVRWTDRKGRDQVTVVTADVDGLTYTRDAEPVNLPQGLGSEANAQRAGERALALTNNPPRAGSATIRRRIFDYDQGCYVWPWEIEPGCVVREQETGDTFRLTEVEYVDADAAAYLTLGEPVRTTEQVVSRLHRRAKRKKK